MITKVNQPYSQKTIHDCSCAFYVNEGNSITYCFVLSIQYLVTLGVVAAMLLFVVFNLAREKELHVQAKYADRSRSAKAKIEWVSVHRADNFGRYRRVHDIFLFQFSLFVSMAGDPLQSKR